MSERYRVEIYDANKLHDVTLYFQDFITREMLQELMYSHIKKFSGDVRGYSYDTKTKTKLTSSWMNGSIVKIAQSLSKIKN